jgi:fructose-1-phosphate kinase PfkB-like protein
VKAHLKQAAWLLLCGSLPRGVPGDFYARLVHRANRDSVPVLVDADGEALEAALAEKPTVVTPNQQEAERLLDRVLLTRSHFMEAVSHIRAMGRGRWCCRSARAERWRRARAAVRWRWFRRGSKRCARLARAMH